MPRQRKAEALEVEQRLAIALEGLQKGEWPTVYKAAKAMKVSKDTLARRWKGKKSCVEARESQQKLTKAEEKVLADWITQLTATGHPARHEFIRELAEEIRRKRHIEIRDFELIPLGKSWVQQFLKRHPHLQTVISRSIEASRIKEVTKEVVINFFEALEACLTKYQISWENVYNMDETGNSCIIWTNIGFAIGTAQTSYVVVDSQLRKKYQAQPGRQEWITVTECVCTDGTSIPPLVIFKGENLMSSWIPKEVDKDWHFSCNSKGWTSNVHGGQYVEKCFDVATRDKANGQYRLLLCDGHDSHISAQFVRYCLDHKIVLFLLPPHSSHILQPLDVGVFGPLKTAMATQLSKLFASEISKLQKVEWVEKYILARAKGITALNIQGGWRGAGLFPLNRYRVLRTISDSATPPPLQEDSMPITPYLISSPPPHAITL